MSSPSLSAALALFLAALFLVAAAPAARAQGPDAPVAVQFVNGDFDDGPGIGWSEHSKLNFAVVVDDFGAGVSAHSPRYAAWLGGYDLEQASVEQTVTVTSATPVLRYWHWIDSDEQYCTFDLARVYAGGSVVSTVGLCGANNTGGWASRTVDLSVFEGQAIPVKLQVDTDCCTLSSQYLDDVALEASPLGPLAVSAGRNAALVHLSWQHASPYTGYEVWRSQSPYFLIAAVGSEKRADVAAPAGALATYDDAGATGNAAANYFYLVRGAGSGTTRTSNRMGEFDFSMVKGG